MGSLGVFDGFLAGRRPDRLSNADLSSIYPYMKAAIGVCTNPGLVHDRRTVLSEIRKRNEDALIALLALWEFRGFDPCFH